MGKEKNEEHGGGGAEVQRELTWALDRELWVCYQRSCTIEAVNSSKNNNAVRTQLECVLNLRWILGIFINLKQGP